MTNPPRQLGSLEGRFSTGGWPRPVRIAVDAAGEHLEWEYGSAAHYQKAEAWATREVQQQLLRQFLGLARPTVQARDIERFALKWGVFGHDGRRAPGESGRDSLERWFWLLGTFQGIQGWASALWDEREPAAADIERAGRVLPKRTDPALDPYTRRLVGWWEAQHLVALFDGSETAQRLPLEMQWRILGLALNSLLGRLGEVPAWAGGNASVRAAYDAERGGLRIRVGEESLEAALIHELMVEVCSESAFTLCAGCGKEIERRVRGPGGRRAFCDSCGLHGAQRQASADYRARRKEAERLLAAGMSATAVAAQVGAKPESVRRWKQAKPRRKTASSRSRTARR